MQNLILNFSYEVAKGKKLGRIYYEKHLVFLYGFNTFLKHSFEISFDFDLKV